MRHKGLLLGGLGLFLVGLLGLASLAVYEAVYQAGRDVTGPQGRQRGYGDGGDERPAPRGPGRGRGGRGFDFSTDPSDYPSVGERIYFSGYGSAGRIDRDPRYGPSMMGGCAVCHGAEGRGGTTGMMFGSVVAPDIRYSTLTSAHPSGESTAPGGSEDSTGPSTEATAEPGWTDDDIRRAIRDGVEPDGERLQAPMPRWDMSDSDMDELIAYLKQLDAGAAP